MKISYVKSSVLELLRNGKGYTLTEIAHSLGIGRKNRYVLKKALKELGRENLISIRKSRYYLRKPRTLQAIIRLTPRGFAFALDVDTGVEYFIPREYLKGASDGDTVIIKPLARDRAKVVAVIEKRQKKAVALVAKKETLLPFSRSIPFLKLDDPTCRAVQEIKEGQIWEVEINENRACPVGKLAENIDENEEEVDFRAIVYEFNLPVVYPMEALQEAESLTPDIPEEEYRVRADLRSVPVVTIDGEDAKDFDDAITVYREGKNYRVMIHIADVSYYVKKGSAIDKEAFRRGNSYYLGTRFLPMLPPRLTSEIASLKEGKDKLAITVELLVDPYGEIVEGDIYPSIIRVDRRLNYPQVQSWIDSFEEELPYNLRDAVELVSVLLKERASRGAVDIEQGEIDYIFDEEGRIVSMRRRKRYFSEMLIEELMILANRFVAAFLQHEFGSAMYLIHERPTEKKISALLESLSSMGYRFRLKKKRKVRPGFLRDIIESTKKEEHSRIVSYLVLRSMPLARYSAVNKGHFGLALKHYTHFTSPIRRYPDLVVHRLLKGEDYTVNELNRIAVWTSLTERVADDAERAFRDLKGARLVSKLLKEGKDTFDALVILDPEKEGWLGVETEEGIFGYLIGGNFRVGEKIKVKVSEVVVPKRIVVFEPG